MGRTRVDLNLVDLNLLVALDALMSEGSVTRAAARLSVGQSAMSSTLARLRKLFDDPLLVREGRGLIATPLAESLTKQVRAVLDQIESILTDPTDFDPASDKRTFTIVASDVLSVILLKPLRARLAVEAPGVRVQASPPAGDDAERLTRNQVDLVVTPRDAFLTTRTFGAPFCSLTATSVRSTSTMRPSARRCRWRSSARCPTWPPPADAGSQPRRRSSIGSESRETSNSLRASVWFQPC